MPTIEVTREQAQALARGENITISAPKPEPPKPLRRYIFVVAMSKNVYEIRTDQDVPVGENVTLPKGLPPAVRISSGRGVRVGVLRPLGGFRGTVVKA